MFTLIIVIIAVALVAALAVAAIYYGASAWSQGRARAEAAALIAQAQQIAEANELYANDNSGAFSFDGSSTPGSGITALVSGGYLAAVPQVPSSVGGSLTLPESSPPNVLAVVLTNELVCEAVNADAAGSSTLTSPPTAFGPGHGKVNCGGNAGTYQMFYVGD